MTERRETALKMLRLNRAHAVLRNISRLFMRERSKKKILEESCRIAVEDGKLSMCWIGLVDETAGMVKPVAYAGDIEHDTRMLHCGKKALNLGLKSPAAFPLQTAAKGIGTISHYAKKLYLYICPSRSIR